VKDLWLGLANGLMGRPDPRAKDSAERLVREVLTIDPNSVPGLGCLAVILGTSGRVDEAIELNRRLLVIAPDNARALNDLAWILSEEKGQYEEALPLAAKALACDPKNPDALDTYGVICFHLGRLPEAEKNLNEAMGVMPPAFSGAVEVRYHLAHVYEALGRDAQAADLFQRSLNLRVGMGGLDSGQVSHAEEFLRQHPALVAAAASEPPDLGGQPRPETPSLERGLDSAAPRASQPVPQDQGTVVHDVQLYEAFLAGLARLIEDGRATKTAVLMEQLQRSRCSLVLPDVPTRKMTLTGLYQNCRNSVLLVGHLYLCPQCGRRHANIAGGFVLTVTGAIATNYHVTKHPESLAFGAMTADGKMYAVKEVLAADEQADVALLQLDGSGFTPLALRAQVPVGAPVAVIGHPGNSFYSLTPGFVSRYFTVERGNREITWIAATANIGAGSSGAPLLDECGTVVGMAAQVRVVRNTRTEDHQPVPQMTVDMFVPAEAILRLVHSVGDNASRGASDAIVQPAPQTREQ
jgi:S1-C subfamily serine protease/Tfp pilus assembly protein PilF